MAILVSSVPGHTHTSESVIPGDIFQTIRLGGVFVSQGKVGFLLPTLPPVEANHLSRLVAPHEKSSLYCIASILSI